MTTEFIPTTMVIEGDQLVNHDCKPGDREGSGLVINRPSPTSATICYTKLCERCISLGKAVENNCFKATQSK